MLLLVYLAGALDVRGDPVMARHRDDAGHVGLDERGPGRPITAAGRVDERPLALGWQGPPATQRVDIALHALFGDTSFGGGAAHVNPLDRTRDAARKRGWWLACRGLLQTTCRPVPTSSRSGPSCPAPPRDARSACASARAG